MPSKASAPSSRSSAQRRRTRNLTTSEWCAIGAALAVVFAGVALFGASELAVAASFAGLQALLLLGLLSACGWARRDLAALPGLPLEAGVFVLLMAVVLWPLTPWGPDGPHPIWHYLPGQTPSLAIDRSALVLNALQLLGLACLFVAVRIIAVSEGRARWLVRAVLVGLAVYATLALLDHAISHRAPRLAATLLSANSAASLFGAGLVLAVAESLGRLRRRGGLKTLRGLDPATLAMIACAAVLATDLMLTASRAGTVATLTGLGLLITWELLAERSRARGAVLMAAAAMVLFVAAISLRSLGGLADRLDLAGHDVAIRQTLFAPHWAAFLSAPWNGYGLGAFPTVNQLVVTQGSLNVLQDVRAAHNLYLQWLEEGGIIGSAAMAALFGVLIAPVLVGALRQGRAATTCRAVICMSVVLLVHGLTDFALQVPALQAAAVLMLGAANSMVRGRGPAAQRLAGVKTPAGFVLAAGVSVAAVLLAAPLLASRLGGDLSSWPTAPASALASRIESDLAKPRPTPDQLGEMLALSDRELRMRPASGSAWLRRAAIEAAAGRDDASSLALERSFAVSPLQTSLFDQRIRFAYEHWGRISQTAREAAVYQLSVEWRRRFDPKRFVAIANGLANPAGRLGMALQISVLRAEPCEAPVSP